MMRRILIMGLVLMVGALRAASGSGVSSDSGVKILRDPRGAAQAGAMVAGADNVASLEWNPAGLVAMRDVQFSFSHLEWIDGVRSESVGLGVPLYGFGAWGLGANYLYVQDLARDDWGQPGAALNIFNFDLKAAFGFQLGADGAFAASYRIIRQGYESAFTMGSAFDVGFRYEGFLSRKLKLGLVSKNMGTNLSAGSSFAPMAWTLEGGARFLVGLGLSIEVDHSYQPNSFVNKTRLGAEWAMGSSALGLDLRGGYLTGPENTQGSLAGLSTGIGLHWAGWDLDYAYAPQGDLGTSQRASLTYHFGVK